MVLGLVGMQTETLHVTYLLDRDLEPLAPGTSVSTEKRRPCVQTIKRQK